MGLCNPGYLETALARPIYIFDSTNHACHKLVGPGTVIQRNHELSRSFRAAQGPKTHQASIGVI